MPWINRSSNLRTQTIVTVSATAPTSPIVNDIWVDIS